MPTGYTAKLMEQGQEFPEFVMQCARAFGALVMMRDDPMDAAIPEKFKPSDYSIKALKEAKAKLAKLEKMTPKQRIEYGAAKQKEEIANKRKYIAKGKKENERLDAMNQKVEAWEPPTSEHEGLKKFMLEQISISRNSLDYWEKSLSDTEAKQPIAFFREALTRAGSDIAYHTKSQSEEEARTDSRTEWVQQLRNSL